jgi:hypothetical protein
MSSSPPYIDYGYVQVLQNNEIRRQPRHLAICGLFYLLNASFLLSCACTVLVLKNFIPTPYMVLHVGGALKPCALVTFRALKDASSIRLKPRHIR